MVSRVILIGCPGTSLFFEFVALGHAAFSSPWAWSGFESAGLGVLVRVDGQFAQDLAGVAVDDDDVEVVDEHADGCSAQVHAEFDVVHASAAAQSDRAGGVDDVVADAEVSAAVVFGGGFGSGVTSPARVRIRQIVVTEGGVSNSSVRIAAMECGPASAPYAISSARSATIRSSTAAGVAFGFDRGRLDCGSTAAQPPARHAATS